MIFKNRTISSHIHGNKQLSTHTMLNIKLTLNYRLFRISNALIPRRKTTKRLKHALIRRIFTTVLSSSRKISGRLCMQSAVEFYLNSFCFARAFTVIHWSQISRIRLYDTAFEENQNQNINYSNWSDILVQCEKLYLIYDQQRLDSLLSVDICVFIINICF